MEKTSHQANWPLRKPSSHLSEHSINSKSTLVDCPSPPHLRQVYRRANSAVEEDSSDHGAGISLHDGYGLAISGLEEQEQVSIARKSVGNNASPGSADLLLSPVPAYRSDEDQEETLHSSSKYSLHQPFTPNSDCEPLHKGSEAEFECRMKKPPEKKRSSWLAISLLILSVYSTILSGIWLLIAIEKFPYGRVVSRKGVPIGTVSTLSTAFAKSIELSFVTVSVAFIGQALSKRARFQTKGITIAEMSMRMWIMQPGTMVGHWEAVRYAAATRLGIFSLLVALMAMLYTTASDALVTPVLKFSEPKHRTLYGKVSASFANPDYIVDHCETPIQQAMDSENYGETCLDIKNAGQAFHNYMQYITTWESDVSSGNISDSLVQRPDPVGMVSNF